MREIELKAPAKINLFLELLGPRGDGFTEIRSLVQTVSLYDIVRIELTDGGLRLSSNNSELPLGAGNTAARAWGVFCQATGGEMGARIHLEKNIPVGSGLGGGSSDAAAVLVGLARLKGLELDRETLTTLGSAVGSDVPLFFGSGCSIISGRGEVVEDVTIPRNYGALLVKPDYGMSTEEAYSAVRKGLTVPASKVNIQTLDFSGGVETFCTRGNDLERALLALHPEAEEIEKRLISAGALCASMSGSGSAFFGIFENLEAAEAAADDFGDMWSAAVEPVEIDF